jgi:hypothetical protein
LILPFRGERSAHAGILTVLSVNEIVRVLKSANAIVHLANSVWQFRTDGHSKKITSD